MKEVVAGLEDDFIPIKTALNNHFLLALFEEPPAAVAVDWALDGLSVCQGVLECKTQQGLGH